MLNQTNRPIKSSSAIFRTISRQKVPSWTNRFVRDQHDLQYDYTIDPIKNVHKNNKKLSQKKKIFQYTPKKNLLNNKQTKQKQSIQFNTYLNQNDYFQQNTAQSLKLNTSKQKDKRKNKIRQVINEKNNVNFFGLSPYEFNKTISGNVGRNNHLNLKNMKSNKIDNKNFIWYRNEGFDKIQKDITSAKDAKQRLDQVHTFKSYSGHNLFASTSNDVGEGGMLDKFYDFNRFDLVRSQQSSRALNHKKITSRKTLSNCKVSTQLQYDVNNNNGINSKNMMKKGIIDLSRMKRQLKITKQIISLKQGYR